MSQPALTAPPSRDPIVDHPVTVETTDAQLPSVSHEPRNGPSNLGLLLDVELNVLLRFGQRSLTLREVLDLKCGSVIELDRRVDEPVELLLDGRVIARGNAAIVDGNYGLQITEVLQTEPPARAADFPQGQRR
jgi:flagellar motor switch protein FliN